MSGIPCQYRLTTRKRGRKPLRGALPTSADGDANRTDIALAETESPLLATSPSPAPSQSFSTACPSPGPSPHSTTSPQPTRIQPRSQLNSHVQALHDQLISTLVASVPHLDGGPNTIINDCIDIAVQTVFPIGPIFHEQSLRSSLPLKAPLLGSDSPTQVSSTSAYELHVTDPDDVAKLRSYASLTALCAAVSFLPQAKTIANNVLIGQSFLRASRAALELYHDFDVSYPNSSSLIIRTWHASALHTDGKTTLAWHAFNQIMGFIEQMQLFDELSYQGLEPLEARLRRSSFWQVYILDRYAALVEGKPMRMHQFSLAKPITTRVRTEVEPPLLMESLGDALASHEDQLMAGFYLIQQLWATASEVSLDLQVVSRLCNHTSGVGVTEEATRQNLAATYLRFIGVLDTLPRHLDCLDPISSSGHPPVGSSQQMFWLQKAHLLVTYHCLRIIFLQRFADLGLAQILGYGSDAIALASRKMEVAHDFITVITTVPFDCLLANGESC
ncbi:hypothetical protein NW762_012198, partial [Fusarium torreyae]